MSSKKPKPVTAIGMEKTKAGYRVIEFQIDGDKVVKRKASEPDLRSIALDQLVRQINIFFEDSTFETE